MDKRILNLVAPPLQANLPVVQKLIELYKLWNVCIRNIPRTSRYTLGEKVEQLLIEVLDAVSTAAYLEKQQKLPYIKRAISRLDIMKFFLQVAWETNTLGIKRFISMSEKANEVGRMLNGWAKHTAKENPAD